MNVTVYRLASGALTLVQTEGAEPVEAELTDGYRVGEGIGGSSSVYVFGGPGELGMTAERAIERGVLTLSLTK